MQHVGDDMTRDSMQKALETHLESAKSELDYKQRCRQKSKESNSNTLHLIIDFSEKVLLPSLVR